MPNGSGCDSELYLLELKPFFDWYNMICYISELYLLELKPQNDIPAWFCQLLWIVPIGIETDQPAKVDPLTASSELYLLELKPKITEMGFPDANTLNCTYWNWNPVRFT